jgi:colicin import membrane protein
VPLYVIVDLVQRKGQITPRLLGFRQTPSVYKVLPPDESGRLPIEPLNIWLGVQEQQVICYDASGQPIGDYPELQAALDAEQAARMAEAEARAAAEQRIQELEAEIRQLRGQS